MTREIDEARDWRGLDIDCAHCAHRDLLVAARCELRKACVHDRYARRIDRFFNWNPEFADGYLAHPHFEVRAIAAKFANPFLLPRLLSDPDETVRWEAVRRLPARYRCELRNDSHREVRIRVATLLDDPDLLPMMQDEDYYVRIVIARKVAPALLVMMLDDPEVEVRRIVAQRIDAQWLGRMCRDSNADVRLEAAQRLTPEQLSDLREDDDWRVRHYVATRLNVEEIGHLINDRDPLVAEAARERLAGEASKR
ncbi:4Fe4S-binding leucine-rich repeat protein [Methylocystis sp.]|uniref:4Fe4S-binding leucine-rich repeat protein n=1 Tax=Methylocystis sp. TaxID=1911079 RepID=UPI0025CD90D4|nr:4Fe4S-binding leucine-rich repeat protein [Methylocystis sp.]